MKFGESLPSSFYEIQIFQKSELGKFIPNFPLKYVITSTKSKEKKSLNYDILTRMFV